jgi:hypothetical protein
MSMLSNLLAAGRPIIAGIKRSARSVSGVAPEGYRTDPLRRATGGDEAGAAGVDCQCIPARPR